MTKHLYGGRPEDDELRRDINETSAPCPERDPMDLYKEQRDDDLPEITNEMKARFMGHYTVPVTKECGECIDTGAEDDCDLCGGEIVFRDQHTIPWDTVKQIFKDMYGAMIEGQQS